MLLGLKPAGDRRRIAHAEIINRGRFLHDLEPRRAVSGRLVAPGRVA